MKIACKDKPCGCGGQAQSRMPITMGAKPYNAKFQGKQHLVVPVIMVREIVLNGALIRAEQILAHTWNGVPVTVSHPMKGDLYVTANAPDILEKYCVGRIFNARLEDNKLHAEAWIDIEIATRNYPGLVARLKSGTPPMDVSVGYYPTVINKSGEFEGKTYNEVHTELKPDHLALLPDEEGACSWKDGCGVRANRMKGQPMAKTPKLAEALLAALTGKKLKVHEIESEDDRRQCVADLVSDSNSPFGPQDMDALMMLTPDALGALEEKFLGDGETETAEDDEKDDEKDDVEAQAYDEDEDDEDKPKSNKKQKKDVVTMTKTELASLVSQAVKAELDQRDRAGLVEKIVANKALELTADDLKGMSLKVLKRLAAEGNEPEPKKPATNYGARGGFQPKAASGNVKRFPGMAGAPPTESTTKQAKEA